MAAIDLERFSVQELEDLVQNASHVISKKIGDEVLKNLKEVLRAIEGFQNCAITYYRNSAVERAEIAIQFAQGPVYIHLYSEHGSAGDDRYICEREVETSFGKALMEQGGGITETTIDFRVLNFEGWTLLDTQKLLRTVIENTARHHEQYDFVFRTLWAPAPALTTYNQQALQQSVYEEACKLDLSHDDVEVTYTIDDEMERCILVFYNNQSFMYQTSMVWTRGYQAFPVYELQYNPSPEMIRIAMPIHGERIIQAELRTKPHQSP